MIDSYQAEGVPPNYRAWDMGGRPVINGEPFTPTHTVTVNGEEYPLQAVEVSKRHPQVQREAFKNSEGVILFLAKGWATPIPDKPVVGAVYRHRDWSYLVLVSDTDVDGEGARLTASDHSGIQVWDSNVTTLERFWESFVHVADGMVNVE